MFLFVFTIMCVFALKRNRKQLAYLPEKSVQKPQITQKYQSQAYFVLILNLVLFRLSRNIKRWRCSELLFTNLTLNYQTKKTE